MKWKRKNSIEDPKCLSTWDFFIHCKPLKVDKYEKSVDKVAFLVDKHRKTETVDKLNLI